MVHEAHEVLPLLHHIQEVLHGVGALALLLQLLVLLHGLREAPEAALRERSAEDDFGDQRGVLPRRLLRVLADEPPLHQKPDHRERRECAHREIRKEFDALAIVLVVHGARGLREALGNEPQHMDERDHGDRHAKIAVVRREEYRDEPEKVHRHDLQHPAQSGPEGLRGGEGDQQDHGGGSVHPLYVVHDGLGPGVRHENNGRLGPRRVVPRRAHDVDVHDDHMDGLASLVRLEHDR
mmetsp:Transcript_23981/g.75063  ORF Transcript_23981/g.75063 Transcript_23981/m.75063 type:complete len:237 (-) Transcript_23981:565-1275(-)